MHYYRISAADYEESYQTTYYSFNEYSQKEFEDIVVEAYKKVCQKNIDEDESEVCFSLNFSVEEIMWDYKNYFDDILEKDYGLFSLSKKLSAHVGFDLTHHGGSEKMDIRIRKALGEIEIDESCWDNNCSRLPDGANVSWKRGSCLVYKRKESKVEERNCENCVLRRYDIPKCGDELCNSWIWDGDGTIKRFAYY